MIIKALIVAILAVFPSNVISRAEEENPIPRVTYDAIITAPSPTSYTAGMPHFPSVLKENVVSCEENVLVDSKTSPTSIPLSLKDDTVPEGVAAIACGAILSLAKSKTHPTTKPIIWEAEADDFLWSMGTNYGNKIIWELEGDDFRAFVDGGVFEDNVILRSNGDSGGPFGIGDFKIIEKAEESGGDAKDISVNMPDIIAKRIWEEEAGDFIVKLIWGEESGDFIVQVGKTTYSVRNDIKQSKWVITGY